MLNNKLFETCIISVNLIIFLFVSTSYSTFSICAVDTVTKEVGSAGASCIPGVIIISDPHPGVGVIHTQSYWNRSNQINASKYMDSGDSPDTILKKVIDNDVQNNSRIRQYGIVDLINNGRSAGFSGQGCLDYKGHILGKIYSIQGNILLGRSILQTMEKQFNETQGTIADKLMAALQGAKVRGADTRCFNQQKSSISAFLRVAKPNDRNNNFYLDLNVNNTTGNNDPIDALQRKYNAWVTTNIKNTQRTFTKSKTLFFKSIKSQQNSVKFTYFLPQVEKVCLNIVTPRGKLVKKLVKSIQGKGEHTVTWNNIDKDKNSNSCGVYIAIIQAGNHCSYCKVFIGL